MAGIYGYPWTLLVVVTWSSLFPCVSGDICMQDVCEYRFVVRRLRTMTYVTPEAAYNVALNGTRLQVVENSFRRPGDDDNVGRFVDPSDVITADGYPRDVITINGQFPGPTIEVMEGAQVVVHVDNRLPLEALSLHWHGLHMRNTPFMDGVSYVTQCPVLPLQTFTYRFRAHPSGTHWYHSHHDVQRLDGLSGMIVVHRRLPEIPEHVVSLADWYHADATTIGVLNAYSLRRPGTGEVQIAEPRRDYMADNTEVTSARFFSALINGRGSHDGAPYPLATFPVSANRRYRFRLAHTGAEFSFEVSVDAHALTVVASDGHDVTPVAVDSIIVHPGETVDYEITADQQPGLYLLRAVTLRTGGGRFPISDGIENGVNATVEYDVTSGGSATFPRECTEPRPCKIFNCPFGFYPKGSYKLCIGVESLTSMTSQETLTKQYGLNDDDDDVVELFLNMGFPIGSAINGRRFAESRAPLSQRDWADHVTGCDEDECDDRGCMCTVLKTLPYNRTIQLVLSALTPGGNNLAHHVVHLHGHDFAVLRIAHGQQNESTGFWSGDNNDIICTSDNRYLCSRQQWNGRRPALNKVTPPVKDSVLVPARGYTVIRFRSDNPGFWLLHCHQEYHRAEGMALILNEAPGKHPATPDGFPECRGFGFSAEEYKRYISGDYRLANHESAEPDPEVTSRPLTSVTSQAIHDQTTQVTPASTPESRVTLTLTQAAGLAFAFLLVGAALSLLPLVVRKCIANSSEK